MIAGLLIFVLLVMGGMILFLLDQQRDIWEELGGINEELSTKANSRAKRK